jgi:hypothetical protein
MEKNRLQPVLLLKAMLVARSAAGEYMLHATRQRWEAKEEARR